MLKITIYRSHVSRFPVWAIRVHKNERLVNFL